MKPTSLRQFSWVVLGGLLGVLFVSATAYSRAGWETLAPGEATSLMQAASLAHDFDLAYTRADHERMALTWGFEPNDLELASGSEGRRIAFHQPFPYAVFLAPFVRAAPETGFALANVLLLALAAAAAALTLERYVGETAALTVALAVFGSAAFSYVFLAGDDIFLLSVTVLAFALLTRVEQAAEPGSTSFNGASQDGAPLDKHLGVWRSAFLAGVLLAIPLATEPLLYVVLAVAAFAGLPRDAKLAPQAPFLLGLGAFFALILAVQWWTSGGLHIVGTTHFRFTPETGFPLVDFRADQWNESLRHLSAIYWDETPNAAWGRDLKLWLWDGAYLLVGRHVGLLLYFLPALFLIGLGDWRMAAPSFRLPLLLAIAAWAVIVVLSHPFNIYGGPGAIANRWFLPLYGALWLVPRRPLERWIWPVLTAVAASLFIGGLAFAQWRSSADLARGVAVGHATPVAQAVLPFETSQRWLFESRDADHGGVRILMLSENVWYEERPDRMMLDRRMNEPTELILASDEPLTELELTFGPDAPSHLQVEGATVGDRLLNGDGGITFRLRPGSGRQHAVWWTGSRQWLYPLTLVWPADEGVAPGESPVSLPFWLTTYVAAEPFAAEPLAAEPQSTPDGVKPQNGE